ncbi:MAG: FHA domain-containing protein [Clostridium sp.]
MVTLNYDDNKLNRKLIAGMQLINVFIGAIIALICVVAYITIDEIHIRTIIISGFIIAGIACFVNLYNRLHKEEVKQDISCIRKLQLVNEENEIINTWDIGERISFVIGKSTPQNKVFIDLSNSIYSDFIDDNHAVLNYAGGKWYIEDLSAESGVYIQKKNDDKLYRIVQNVPCEIMRGDILFIYKVKILLK